MRKQVDDILMTELPRITVSGTKPWDPENGTKINFMLVNVEHDLQLLTAKKSRDHIQRTSAGGQDVGGKRKMMKRKERMEKILMTVVLRIVRY